MERPQDNFKGGFSFATAHSAALVTQVCKNNSHRPSVMTMWRSRECPNIQTPPISATHRVKEQVSPLPWSFVFVTAFKKVGDAFKMGKYHPEFKVITLRRANGGNEKMPPSTFEWLVLWEEPVHDPGMGTWSSLHLQKHLENFIASFSLKEEDRRSSVE